jgi:hypothetical protein
MQHLTNLRYRFNDGDFFKNMAYPEVEFSMNAQMEAQLFNLRFWKREAFDQTFKDIIWVSYRRNFPPMLKRIGQ